MSTVWNIFQEKKGNFKTHEKKTDYFSSESKISRSKTSFKNSKVSKNFMGFSNRAQVLHLDI